MVVVSGLRKCVVIVRAGLTMEVIVGGEVLLCSGCMQALLCNSYLLGQSSAEKYVGFIFLLTVQLRDEDVRHTLSMCPLSVSFLPSLVKPWSNRFSWSCVSTPHYQPVKLRDRPISSARLPLLYRGFVVALMHNVRAHHTHTSLSIC